MQQLRIIVKPFKLESVLHAIAGDEDVTVTHIEEVKGYTEIRDKRKSFYRESEFTIDYLPKKYLSVLCPDEKVDHVVEQLREYASTAEVGDGKIFCMPVVRYIDIHRGD